MQQIMHASYIKQLLLHKQFSC